MRQVPKNTNQYAFYYAIVGDGRLARHLAHYFALLGLPFTQWSRKLAAEPLETVLAQCSHALWLVKDSVIEDLSSPFLDLPIIHIHCSGLLHFEKIYGAHPLMTFGSQLYDLPTYTSIPICLEKGLPQKKEIIMPGLPNPVFEIQPELKPLYHAYCVMSGNFTTLLWQRVFDGFAERLKVDPLLLKPYLQQITKNLLEDPKGALTGPLARRDMRTIERNLKALEGDPFHKVYLSFVEAVAESSAAKKEEPTEGGAT